MIFAPRFGQGLRGGSWLRPGRAPAAPYSPARPCVGPRSPARRWQPRISCWWIEIPGLAGANTVPLLPEQCFQAGIPHPLAPTFAATGCTLCFAWQVSQPAGLGGQSLCDARETLSEGCRGFVLTGLTGAAHWDVPGSGGFLARLRGKAAPAAERFLPVLAAAPAAPSGSAGRKGCG